MGPINVKDFSEQENLRILQMVLTLLHRRLDPSLDFDSPSFDSKAISDFLEVVSSDDLRNVGQAVLKELKTPSHVKPLLRRREEILGQASLSTDDESELKELTQAIGALDHGESAQELEAMNIIRRAAKLIQKEQLTIEGNSNGND
jgi:hypothetical protein